VVHWSTAISFCILGLSGLIMLFGKHVLLPIIGYTLFAWLTSLGKNLHNFIAPLFIVSVIAMVIIWVRDNLPKAYDAMWFRHAWGFFMRGEHIPSGRFNAGEKPGSGRGGGAKRDRFRGAAWCCCSRTSTRPAQ